MLYWLSAFSDTIGPLNVLRYITFRTGGAMITALVCVFLFGPAMAAVLRRRSGAIRPAGPIIVSALMVAALLWANPSNRYVWIVLGVTLAFGAIGFYDDYLDATKRSAVPGAFRIAIAAFIALAACLACVHLDSAASATSFRALFGKVVDLGWPYLPVGALVIVAAGNIVNLADRLDGRATVPVIIAALSFGFIAFLAGNMFFADYLNIHYVAGVGELAVLCGAAIGAGLGFLWLNASPASNFMGDTGSLALGGMLGTVAVATRHEVVLVLICCLFLLVGVRPNLTTNG